MNDNADYLLLRMNNVYSPLSMKYPYCIFILLVFVFISSEAWAYNVVVADSVSHVPLPNASIYNGKGDAIGISNHRGVLPKIPRDNYPITIRYIGFNEKTVAEEIPDTIFLSENASELPEVVVETRRHRVLHMLAYIREYSTLSTYSDTVFLFREKMVDYMLPSDDKVKFKGWSVPRILTSKSYYRFTNSNGLDSVSDTGRHHFSWSDWIGLVPKTGLPARLKGMVTAKDTLLGKYSPTETWMRNKDLVSVDVDVLADTVSRKWVPNLAGFFRKGIDFERFKVKYDCKNVIGDSISAFDLAGYSFNIESNGRGHEMFRFNKINEPVFVSTQADVYVLDKEYITVKEARKWNKRRFDVDEVGIYEPLEAPALAPSTLALIDRVNKLDKNSVRLDFTPDKRMIGKYSGRRNYKIGHRALSLLKDVTGITLLKSHKNFNGNWNKLREKQLKKN